MCILLTAYYKQGLSISCLGVRLTVYYKQGTPFVYWLYGCIPDCILHTGHTHLAFAMVSLYKTTERACFRRATSPSITGTQNTNPHTRLSGEFSLLLSSLLHIIDKYQHLLLSIT